MNIDLMSRATFVMVSLRQSRLDRHASREEFLLLAVITVASVPVAYRAFFTTFEDARRFAKPVVEKERQALR
jgi:hypothetical protein